MNENTWKIIPEGTIRIDFSGCRYVDEIHEKLKESFGFPEDYGANWSAFWDYLDDFCGDRESVTAPGKMKVDTEKVPTFIFCCRIAKRKE